MICPIVIARDLDMIHVERDRQELFKEIEY
jgi:hypothetical protein